MSQSTLCRNFGSKGGGGEGIFSKGGISGTLRYVVSSIIKVMDTGVVWSCSGVSYWTVVLPFF